MSPDQLSNAGATISRLLVLALVAAPLVLTLLINARALVPAILMLLPLDLATVVHALVML